MSLRRGDLVTVAAKGSYTAKPRPALVVSPKSFGRLTAADLGRVDTALRFWLGL